MNKAYNVPTHGFPLHKEECLPVVINSASSKGSVILCMFVFGLVSRINVVSYHTSGYDFYDMKSLCAEKRLGFVRARHVFIWLLRLDTAGLGWACLSGTPYSLYLHGLCESADRQKRDLTINA